MSLKVIFGIVQIVISIILIIAMVFGITLVRSSIKDNINLGYSRLPSDLKSGLNLNIIERVLTASSILVGLAGILFLLQGIINLKKDHSSTISEKSSTKENKKEIKTEENIPDEY